MCSMPIGHYSYLLPKVRSLVSIMHSAKSHCPRAIRRCHDHARLVGNAGIHIRDTLALNHVILSKSYSYQHPAETRNTLERFLGRGLVVADGDVHRRQRRIMQAPFSWATVWGHSMDA